MVKKVDEVGRKEKENLVRGSCACVCVFKETKGGKGPIEDK